MTGEELIAANIADEVINQIGLLTGGQLEKASVLDWRHAITVVLVNYGAQEKDGPDELPPAPEIRSSGSINFKRTMPKLPKE